MSYLTPNVPFLDLCLQLFQFATHLVVQRHHLSIPCLQLPLEFALPLLDPRHFLHQKREHRFARLKEQFLGWQLSAPFASLRFGESAAELVDLQDGDRLLPRLPFFFLLALLSHTGFDFFRRALELWESDPVFDDA